MLKLNTEIVLKIILIFALLNSSLFIGLNHPSGFIRLILVLFMNISGVLLIIYCARLAFHSFDSNIYFKFLFIILFCWSSYTIFHGVTFNSKSIMTLFGNYLMAWAWLTPMAVVFGFNISNWISIFKYSGNLLLIISVFIVGIAFYEIRHNLGFLEWMTFLPIMFMTYFIQNNRNKKIVILGSIAYLLFSYGASQRVNMLFFLLMMFFLMIEYFRNSKIHFIKKSIALTAFIILSLLFVLKFETLARETMKNKALTANTRTFLFVELFSDLSPEERIIGKGAMGTYFSDYFYNLIEQDIEGGDSPVRSSVEVGYLQMILKGGYIMMALYLLILIPAAYLGIFRSKNLISRMCGYFILIYILLWTISYYPVYGAEYLLLWMAVGTTISNSSRNVEIKMNQDSII